MKKNILLTLLSGAVLLGLGGCGKNLPTPTTPSNSSNPASYYSYTLSGVIGIPSGGVSLDYPAGVALFGNDVWVASELGNTLEAWTLGGAPALSVASYNSTSFFGPYGVTVAPDGFIYVVDAGNNQVAVFRPTGQYYITLGHNLMNAPAAVAVSGSNVYVSEDNYPGAYYQISITGAGDVKSYGAPVTVTPTGAGALTNPVGIALDASGNLWVCDQVDTRLVKYNAAGVYQQSVTTLGFPVGVAVDPKGNLFASGSDQPIQVYSPSGSAITQFGPSTNAFAQIALDANDDVYVADTLGEDVQIYNRN